MATYPQDANITRHPDRNIPYTIDNNVNIITLGGGYEKRTPTTRRRTRSYTLEYGAVDSSFKNAIESFHVARGGSLESFDFDLSHIHEQGTAHVRFNGPLSIRVINSFGSSNNLYDISITLLEVAN